MDIGEVSLKSYVFEEQKIIITTTEKIGSTYLDNICRNGNDIFYFNLVLKKNKINFEISNRDDLYEKITEKQKYVKIEEIKNNIDNYKFFFLIRNVHDRFRSGIFQFLLNSEIEDFCGFYDYFNSYPIGGSHKLIRKVHHNGLDYLNETDHFKFINIFIEILFFYENKIFSDQHLTTYHKNLYFILKNFFEHDKKIIELKKLDDFLIKNNIIQISDINTLNKNQQISLKTDKTRNFKELLKNIEEYIPEEKIKNFRSFKMYEKLYLQTENIFFNLLKEHYGYVEDE